MEPLEKTSHDLTEDLDKAITDWLRLRSGRGAMMFAMARIESPSLHSTGWN